MFSQSIKNSLGSDSLPIDVSEDHKELWSNFYEKKEPIFMVKKIGVLPTKPGADYEKFTGYVIFMISDYAKTHRKVNKISAYPFLAINFMDETLLDKPLALEEITAKLTGMTRKLRETIEEPLTSFDSSHFPSHRPFVKLISGGVAMLCDNLKNTNNSQGLINLVGSIKNFETDFPCTKSSLDKWGYHLKEYHDNRGNFLTLSLFY